jgi:hypothetical protein
VRLKIADLNIFCAAEIFRFDFFCTDLNTCADEN